jgi:cyclase
VGRWLPLDRILAQTDEQTEIVPGHGPVASRGDLREYRDMLVQVRQSTKGLIAAGRTMDKAVAAVPTKDFDAQWGGGYVSADAFVRMVFTSLIDRGNANR